MSLIPDKGPYCSAQSVFIDGFGVESFGDRSAQVCGINKLIGGTRRSVIRCLHPLFPDRHVILPSIKYVGCLTTNRCRLNECA